MEGEDERVANRIANTSVAWGGSLIPGIAIGVRSG